MQNTSRPMKPTAEQMRSPQFWADRQRRAKEMQAEQQAAALQPENIKKFTSEGDNPAALPQFARFRLAVRWADSWKNSKFPSIDYQKIKGQNGKFTRVKNEQRGYYLLLNLLQRLAKEKKIYVGTIFCTAHGETQEVSKANYCIRLKTIYSNGQQAGLFAYMTAPFDEKNNLILP